MHVCSSRQTDAKTALNLLLWRLCETFFFVSGFRMFKVPFFKSFGLYFLAVITFGNSSASASMKLEDWKTYGYLAEQGAVCASFASLMESQSLLNADLGKLWEERRKYAIGLIRKATQLETGSAASLNDVELLISDYREWMLASLLVPAASPNKLSQGGLQLQTGKDKIKHMIQTYCLSIFNKGDRAIISRFPALSYLTPALEGRTNKTASPNANLKGLETTERTETASSQVTQGSSLSKNSEMANEAAAKVISSMLSTMRPSPISKKDETQKDSVASLTSAGQPSPKPVELKGLSSHNADNFIAQLGSFPDVNLAQSSKQALSAKFPRLFSHIALVIEEHQLSSGTRFFRVRTPNLSRKEARDLCDMLWPHRIICMVRQAG